LRPQVIKQISVLLVIDIVEINANGGFGFTTPSPGTVSKLVFRGVNAKGYGDYTDGFFPANSTTTGGADATLPGCSIADDFSHTLGDPAEGRLAAALNYRLTSACLTGPTGVVQAFAADSDSIATSDVIVPKTPWLENRILRQ